MGWNDGITKDEHAYIKENIKEMTLGEISTTLGRSYSTIQKHAANMGLHRIHRWTAEEDAILIKLRKTFNAEYIAKVIGVNTDCVHNRIRRLRHQGKIL